MIEPSGTKQKEVQDAEHGRIAAMNVLAFQAIRKVQRFIKNRIENIATLPEYAQQRELNRITVFIEQTYKGMFESIRGGVAQSRIESTLEQKYLVEQTLAEVIAWRKIDADVMFPITADYRITRRVLSDKSILRRNKKLAARVALVIKKNLDKGSSIPEIQKKVDIELGLRDKKGRASTKQLKLLKEGRFAHSNGHFYQTYRITRTESMRMASIQSNSTFDQIHAKRSDARLKMVSVIDSRTRAQSVRMNGQVSNAEGEFRYPNGVFYRHGEAPARWTINDRETTVPIFLDAEKIPKPLYKDLSQFKAERQVDLVKNVR